MNPGSKYKSLDGAPPVRRLAARWLLPVLLVLCLSARLLEAQDQDATPQTNDVSEVQGQGMADDNGLGDITQPEEMSQTNGVAPTNESTAPEPDGRSRRLYRQRNRSRGSSQYNGLNGGAGGTNGGPASLDYSAFRAVAEKNIFDPNRHGSTRAGPPPSRSDYFALVGTMSYEKGAFAFFDGTSADYCKAVRPEDAIAGYKVVEITPDAVKLARNTNVFQLSVGTQMRRRDDGSWQQVAASAADTASSGSQSAVSSNDVPSTGADKEVLKRLMQRREKE
jgi:hypothetical protein